MEFKGQSAFIDWNKMTRKWKMNQDGGTFDQQRDNQIHDEFVVFRIFRTQTDLEMRES